MSMDTLDLTTDPKALAQILRQHAEREESKLGYRRISWLLALYYMAGARNFDVLDVNTGEIRYSYTDKENKLEFQSPELLSAVDKVAGQLSSGDLSPYIRRQDSYSLQAIRERAVGQIIADSMVSQQQLDDLVPQFAHFFTLLGSCGITGRVFDHPTIGLTSDLEVIHPRELLPFPSVGTDYTKPQGIMRQRIVSIPRLKKIFGARMINNAMMKNELEWWGQDAWMPLEDNSDTVYPFAGNLKFQEGANPADGNATDPAKLEMAVCKVRELWLYGPRGTCARYIVTSGDKLFIDQDLEGQEVYCRIGFARFMDNGTFHGAGIFDLLFPLVRQAEKMEAALYKNIQEIDQYGVLIIPHGSFNKNTILRDVGKGLKVFPWQPDPISENFKPFAIQPFNAGDIPGRTAAYAKQQMDRVNPIRDLLREKGRVDSAEALQFLDEQINKAMTTPTSGIRRAFGTAYRAVVGDALRFMTLSPRPLPVTRLSVDLAGAVIDPDNMTISFDKNPMPNIGRLHFVVKEVSPKSRVARKSEAVQMANLFKDQGYDFDSFMLFAMEEGLDFAVWSRDYESAFQMVTRNIILLFGDGQEPGEIMLTPQTSRPELQLKVLTSFMAGPMMASASVDVVDSFIEYHETLLFFMGLTLPSAVPNPDDVALLTQIERQMAQQEQQQAAQQGVPAGAA